MGIRDGDIKAGCKRTSQAQERKKKEAAVSRDRLWPLGISVTAGEYKLLLQQPYWLDLQKTLFILTEYLNYNSCCFYNLYDVSMVHVTTCGLVQMILDKMSHFITQLVDRGECKN